MTINTSEEIDRAAVLALRSATGFGQRKFWGDLGVSPAAGCSYETGRSQMPIPVRRLIFLHYVIGIPTDINAEDAKSLSGFGASMRGVRKMKQAIGTAVAQIKGGLETLTSIKD